MSSIPALDSSTHSRTTSRNQARGESTVRLTVPRPVAHLHNAHDPNARPLDEQQCSVIDALYREYSPMMISVARRMVRENCDAEDVVHQLFVRLPTLLAQYKGVSMAGWLKRATVTQCLMHFRSVRRRGECMLEQSDEFASGQQSQPLQHSEINWALQQLSPSLREVIVLRYFMSFSHQECAETLGISAAASEIRTCRAIKQLRLLLQATYSA